jgi:hypothetical protein
MSGRTTACMRFGDGLCHILLAMLLDAITRRTKEANGAASAWPGEVSAACATAPSHNVPMATANWAGSASAQYSRTETSAPTGLPVRRCCYSGFQSAWYPLPLCLLASPARIFFENEAASTPCAFIGENGHYQEHINGIPTPAGSISLDLDGSLHF